MTCARCRQGQQRQFVGFRGFECRGIQYVPECCKEVDKVIKLDHGLLDFWDLFQARIWPVAFDGFGGINCGNIDSSLNNAGINPLTRPLVYDWCILTLTVCQEVRAREKKN